MFLGLHDVLFPTVHVSPPSSFSNHSQWTCFAHTDCVNCQSAVQIRHAHPDIPTSSSTIGILHMIGPNTFWFDSILLPHLSPLHATYATISPSFYHTSWYNTTLPDTSQCPRPNTSQHHRAVGSQHTSRVVEPKLQRRSERPLRGRFSWSVSDRCGRL